MSKWAIVAWHEYSIQVRRKGFLLATFGMPVLMAALFAVVGLLAVGAERVKTVGYVDHAGLLAAQPTRLVLTGDRAHDGALADEPVALLRYADDAAGRSALDGKAIEVLFVVPADYRASGKVTAYAPTRVPDMARSRFETLLRQGLLAGQPADPRLTAPVTAVRELTLDGAVNNPIARIIVPLLYAVLFYAATYSASSYLMQSVVEEKENRLMEVLGTSLRPGALMSGKILGLGLLGLTQRAVWVAGGLASLAVAAQMLPLFNGVTLPWDTVLLMVALFVPSYLLYAASLAAVGAAVSVRQEGQQLAGIFSLAAALPSWFFLSILTDSNGPIATVLSLFPYTAPMTLLLRQETAPLPVWQIPLSLLLVSLAAAGMMWAAGRMLRYGMLRYGQRVGWRELGKALRGG
jgi:ABC-2 type transport system permease protein